MAMCEFSISFQTLLADIPYFKGKTVCPEILVATTLKLDGERETRPMGCLYFAAAVEMFLATVLLSLKSACVRGRDHLEHFFVNMVDRIYRTDQYGQKPYLPDAFYSMSFVQRLENPGWIDMYIRYSADRIQFLNETRVIQPRKQSIITLKPAAWTSEGKEDYLGSILEWINSDDFIVSDQQSTEIKA